MSCYVNPENESKETFLIREGRQVKTADAIITEEELPVCLMDNIRFTAGAIGISAYLLKKLKDPNDLRPKAWFMVSREKLRTVSDLAEHENEEEENL